MPYTVSCDVMCVSMRAYMYCVRQRKSLALSKYVRVRVYVCVNQTLVILLMFTFIMVYPKKGKNATVVLFQTIEKHTHTFTLAQASHNINIFAYGGVAGGVGSGNVQFWFLRWTTVYYSLTTNRQASTVVIITIYDNTCKHTRMVVMNARLL